MTDVHDIYLRFKDHAAVLAFFRRDDLRGRGPDESGEGAIRGAVGDLFDPENSDRLIDVRRSVAHVILPANTVVIDEEGAKDDRVWIVLRLLGDTAQRDLGPGGRWEGSGLIQRVRGQGDAAVKRGARMSRMKFGPHWVEVYNTDDLVSTGVLPHVIAGGPL